jgi:hypothetical protein
LDLATRYGDEPKQLEEAIIDYSLDAFSALNSHANAASSRELFRHDARLNAQGLAVWRQRQET